MRVVLSSCLMWWLVGGMGSAAGDVIQGRTGKCDPFVPLVRDGKVIPCEPTRTRLELTGIVWEPDGTSLALVNGTEVRVGEVVDGYEVIEIRRESVTVVHNGERLVLMLLATAL